MTDEQRKKIKKETLEWIKCIALAVVIALLIKNFLFNSTYVLGNSMYPTLHEKDRLFTNKIVYVLGIPKRGDIVVIDAPDDPEKDYIKRIIGIEGDTVEIRDGEVYLNNELLNEEYLEEDAYTYGNIKIDVPRDEVFVLGDNRHKLASKDSRFFGTVSEKSIKGKASLRYFPFDNRFGSLNKNK